MNKGRIFTAAALAAVAATAQAQEDLKLEISGQLNRAIMHADDGHDSDAFFVDNDNSSSRVRFSGTAGVTPGIKAGLLLEVEYQSSASNLVNFADRDGASPRFDERHVDAFFQGGFGKVSLGQGDGAANGAVEVDLSGTTVVHYADPVAWGGGIAFRTDAGGLGPAMGDVLNQQDFESRYDRLRYDTPSFGGFGLAVSMGAKDDADVHEAALRYSGDLAGLGKLAAALGWSNEEATTPGAVDDEVVGGSVSWLSPAGFNVTYGHTQRDIAAGQEGKYNYVKVGYKFGRHAVSLDYGRADDQQLVEDEAKTWSLGYVFTPVKWADLYAIAKQVSLDRPGASFDDITIFAAGTRLKF